MIKARITGLPQEVTKATQNLKNCFDVLSVSNQSENRNSSYVRIYVDLNLKENDNNE
ncbi:hypothetical protein RBG61_12040 [Paludicola sp. MB14-C6]|uniref:hypothetical protein n=1 Tax=Paludihabitans sp. MB14-C6 TaxID=3070656 RepID=UPI0027DD6C1F|nr:hypothetical protein [Paludicola sp. MB14-C6]WMJ22713.1 hypothetical protein RBG61_12040 [Paludicola sp. MB14-C6]